MRLHAIPAAALPGDAARLGAVFEWFWRRPRRGVRSAALARGGERPTRVDFEELAPGVDTFLGQAAYLQIGFFETLSELIASTPELSKKEALSRAAGAALTKHEELVALIRERGADPTDLICRSASRWTPSARDPRRAAAGDDALRAYHRRHAG